MHFLCQKTPTGKLVRPKSTGTFHANSVGRQKPPQIGPKVPRPIAPRAGPIARRFQEGGRSAFGAEQSGAGADRYVSQLYKNPEDLHILFQKIRFYKHLSIGYKCL